MPPDPLQKLKMAASCRPASEPSHDKTPFSRRPDTPPPGPSAGPRPLFSLPVFPPRAFYTRKMDKAVERLESLQNAELRKSGLGREATQEKNGELASKDTPSRPTISLVGRQSISADTIDIDFRRETTKEEIGAFKSKDTPSRPSNSLVGRESISADTIDIDFRRETIQEEIGVFTSKDTPSRPTISPIGKISILTDKLDYADDVNSADSFVPRKSDSRSEATQEKIGDATSKNPPSRPTISSAGKQSLSANNIDAVDAVEFANIFEPRMSDSRKEATQEKLGGLTSKDEPPRPTFSSVEKQSISAGEADFADDVESADVYECFLVIKAKLPSLRAKEASKHHGDIGPGEPRPTDDHRKTDKAIAQLTNVYELAEHHTSKHKQERVHNNGDIIPKEPQPADVDQTMDNANGKLTNGYDWAEHDSGVGQTTNLYTRAEHHSLKHKQKRLSLRLESLVIENQTDPQTCSAQNSPNGITTPEDLTFGILGPPAYKPSTRPPETSALSDLAKKGRDKLRADKQPSRDSVSANSSDCLSQSSTKCSSTRNPSLWCHQPPLPRFNVCTSRLCPVLVPHRLGFYLHNNTKRTRPEIYFGDSNPPPMVWYAVDLMTEGKANRTDEEIVAEFIKLHHFVARDGS